MAPATINRELAFLRRAFNVAIEDELADKNPISKRGVRLFRENNQRVRYLSADEEQRLRQAIGEGAWPQVAVALYTGSGAPTASSSGGMPTSTSMPGRSGPGSRRAGGTITSR